MCCCAVLFASLYLVMNLSINKEALYIFYIVKRKTEQAPEFSREWFHGDILILLKIDTWARKNTK